MFIYAPYHSQALQEDVLKHQQPIRSLVYQSEQLVEHHQEELTPEQVTELQQLESSIKTSFGKVLHCIDIPTSLLEILKAASLCVLCVRFEQNDKFI